MTDDLEEAIGRVLTIAKDKGQALSVEDMRTLARYAREGVSAGEATVASEHIHRLLRVLAEPFFGPRWTTQLPPHWQHGHLIEDAVERQIARLFQCAFCHLYLRTDRPVPRAWLATLAGLAKSTVAMAAQRGTLESAPSPRRRRGQARAPEESPITPESARLWLADHAVPPYAR